jgi:hypothetical protein
MARREGEHLGCSPCGKVAYWGLPNGWPGPEVLLSRLPKQPDIITFYIGNSREFAGFVMDATLCPSNKIMQFQKSPLVGWLTGGAHCRLQQ